MRSAMFVPARWPLATAAALVLAAGLAATALAAPCPPPDSEVRCPNTETCIRVDRKICPRPPRRPVLTIKRACCKDAKGRIRCQHFEHCPSRSPS